MDVWKDGFLVVDDDIDRVDLTRRTGKNAAMISRDFEID